MITLIATLAIGILIGISLVLGVFGIVLLLYLDLKKLGKEIKESLEHTDSIKPTKALVLSPMTEEEEDRVNNPEWTKFIDSAKA